MKIMHEQIDFPGQSTIKVNFGERPYFSYPWHFHEEHEIVYIIRSTGTRFVGDNIETFGEGDLVMVAGNLPHYWRSDEKYFTENPGCNVKRVIVQFPKDFLHHSIENYTEFFPIKTLFKRAERGLKFNSPDSDQIGKMLLRLTRLKAYARVMYFIDILNFMAHSDKFKLLASEGYQPGRDELTDDRLQKVIRFLVANYFNPVSLSELADVAGMHPASFCRFFKEKTGKSCSAYLNELKIGFACKLLMEGNLQISQICYEVGFNNLSNFNRTFKNITGKTPKMYKDDFFGRGLKHNKEAVDKYF